MPIKKDKKKAPKKRAVAKKVPTNKLPISRPQSGIAQTQSQKVIVNIHKPTAKRTVSKKPTAKPTTQPSASGSIAYNYPLYNSSIPIPRTITATPTPTEMPPSIREPIKSSVAEPVRKSIAIQSEEPVAMKIAVKKPVKTSLELKPGRFNIPSGEPVSLKLPQKNERKRMETEKKLMRNEEMLSIITQPSKKDYPQPIKKSEPLQVNKRRNKQQMDEARQMGREDIASIQLGLTRFNNPPATEISDVMSEVSTTPLYEGGREVPEPKIKRSYIKSGKYSKKPKQPSLIPVVMGESEDTFYPTKPSPELSAKFGEPEPLY